jgi:hypothetical protein
MMPDLQAAGRSVATETKKTFLAEREFVCGDRWSTAREDGKGLTDVLIGLHA